MPHVQKRRKKTLLLGTTPRRSRRIAGVDVESPVVVAEKPKRRVMRTLGIVDDDRVRVDQRALDNYAKLFRQSLSRGHIQTLAAHFGWVPPPDAVGDLSVAKGFTFVC